MQIICLCNEAVPGCELSCSKWKAKKIKPDKVFYHAKWARRKLKNWLRFEESK